MSDLELLREIGQHVRQPAFDELVETRRRRTRRVHGVTAGVVAVATAAVVGVLVSTGHATRTDPPPSGPSPSPSPSRVEQVVVPTGQQTITPDIRPAQVHGFVTVATVTNTQPGHRDDTSLSTTVTVPTDSSTVVYDCQAHDVPTWIAYADGDLVSDSPGGAHDGWTFRSCSDEPMSLAPNDDLPENPINLGDESKTVRMFAMAAPSRALRDCLTGEAPGDCVLPQPISTTDAEFGFRIYENRWAAPVLRLFEDAGNGEPYLFQAVSSIRGTAWLVDRAVVAAPNAPRLAFELPASDQDYLVDVYQGIGPHFGRCKRQHADELPDFETTDHLDYEAAVHEVCGVDVRLVVDGAVVAGDGDPLARGHFQSLGARLSAGAKHEVIVQVVRGDPPNIRYAAVLRSATEMP